MPTTLVPANGGDFSTTNWRALTTVLGRIDLNRYLRPYPHQGRGLLPDGSDYNTNPIVNPRADITRVRFDTAGTAQYLAAQSDRQHLARDIYDRLIAVTGVPVPAQVDPSNAALWAAFQQKLIPLRYLAQLAVNIVDFLDEDDIATPFNFYGFNDAWGSKLWNPGQMEYGGISEGVPLYWVFGTELPRVVLNEALAEYQKPQAGQPTDVKVWVELMNTMAQPPTPAGYPAGSTVHATDGLPIPLTVVGRTATYAPYRVVLGNRSKAALPPDPDRLAVRPNFDNVLGAPERFFSPTTTDAAFVAGGVRNHDNTDQTPPPGVTIRGMGGAGNRTPAFIDCVPPNQAAPFANRTRFFLLGPDDPTGHPGGRLDTVNGDLAGTGTPAPGVPPVPAKTPWLGTPALRAALNDRGTPEVTILLRRLANPYLPPDNNPGTPDQVNPNYNPYVTVDYVVLEGADLQDTGAATNPRKLQARGEETALRRPAPGGQRRRQPDRAPDPGAGPRQPARPHHLPHVRQPQRQPAQRDVRLARPPRPPADRRDGVAARLGLQAARADAEIHRPRPGAGLPGHRRGQVPAPGAVVR
jgi:hypothetical protein